VSSAMDTKAPLLPRTEPEVELETMRRRGTQQRRSRFCAAAFVLVIGLFWLANSWHCDHQHRHEEETAAKVPLEVHIM
jgi:hypothetical protein